MTDKVILVIDKPNACWECMLCGRGVKERFCIARIYQQGNTNDCDIKDVNKVESWCPLRPLPKGHGRLIDADELKILIPTIETEYKYVHSLIDEAPTIIETDTGETE